MFFPKPGYRDTLLSFTLCYGKLPEPWWGMWKERETFYSDDGELKPEWKGNVPVLRIDLESMLRYLRKRARGMGKDEYAWLKRVMLEIFEGEDGGQRNSALLASSVVGGRGEE
jgi:hypothetical protein